mgnify:CR=1 FL=1
MSKFKIIVEESITGIHVRANQGFILWREKVPFEIHYWKKDMPPIHSYALKMICPKHVHHDTEVNLFSSSYFYADGEFCLSAIVRMSMGGTCFKNISREPLDAKTLQEYAPIIKSLEKRVGKILIRGQLKVRER